MNKKSNTLKTWILISCCFFILICSIVYFIQHKTGNRPDTHSIVLTDVGFDTSITFEANCTKEDFDSYVAIVKESFIHYNQLFDQYNAYEGINNVYTLNHEAYENPIEVDPELVDLISYSLAFNEKDTAFDITQGKLLDVWHTYREEGLEKNAQHKSGRLPSEEEIQEARIHSGNDKIQIQDHTIRFTDPEFMIDLGGIAKGYATQKTAEKLEDKGLHTGFINAGGNVVLIGHKSDETWNIGIQDPNKQSSLLQLKTAEPLAIVTSGDYQRNYEVDGVQYAHIIDPKTGYPPRFHRSVTILCEDSTLADALSTALFCMSLEDGQHFIQENYTDVGVVWIDSKDTTPIEPDLSTSQYDIYITANYKDKVRLN